MRNHAAHRGETMSEPVKTPRFSDDERRTYIGVGFAIVVVTILMLFVLF